MTKNAQQRANERQNEKRRNTPRLPIVMPKHNVATYKEWLNNRNKEQAKSW